MEGRLHYYEGYSSKEITFPIRVLQELGIKYLLISNASGAANSTFKKEEIVIVYDHINLLFDNPLRGENIDKYGSRFTDMSAPYDKQILKTLYKVSKEINSKVHKGVYAALQGPSLETRAEYRMLNILGADIVGM